MFFLKTTAFWVSSMMLVLVCAAIAPVAFVTLDATDRMKKARIKSSDKKKEENGAKTKSVLPLPTVVH